MDWEERQGKTVGALVGMLQWGVAKVKGSVIKTQSVRP